MVDHYVPHYDKDAGSRTIYQYIKLFVNCGYNVKFIGDNFYPHEPYTTILEQMGVEVLYSSYYEKHWKEWIKENAEWIHFAFLNRPHITEKYIEYIKKNTSAKIIYYGLDLHYLREYREYLVTGDENLKQSSEKWKEKEFYIMRTADISYTLSDYEAEEIKRVDPTINVRIIPVYIYAQIKHFDYFPEERSNLMFIGGFSHKPNVDAVLWFHNQIWPLIKQLNQTLKIYILGSNPPAEIKALNTDDFVIKGFVSDEELDMFYHNCKLAVVPLRYGAGIKGKVVEAMRYQLPVITTSIGAEGIDSGEILFIEDDAQKFAEKLLNIYSDNELLKEHSRKEVAFVNKNLTEDVTRKIIEKDFSI